MNQTSFSPYFTYSSDHQGQIHDIQYDYYGKRIATTGSDGFVNIFEQSPKNEFAKVGSFKAHNGPIFRLSWSHPQFGNLIATGGFDKKISIWKSFRDNDWKEVYTSDDFQSAVNCVSWAPAEFGLKLAAATADGNVTIFAFNNTWEIQQKIDAHSQGINAISWSPYIPSEEFTEMNIEQAEYQVMIATASCDKTIKIFEFNSSTASFDEKYTLNGHGDWVRDVCWCPSLLNPYHLIASCSEDGGVVLWKADKTENDFTSQELKRVSGSVWRVNWSTTGNMLTISYVDSEGNHITEVLGENEIGEFETISIITDSAESN